MIMITKDAAINSLAQTIYYCRAIVFTLDVPHWDAIGLHLRRDYRQRAQELLETLRPHVPEQDDLFQQVASVAREDAARVLARITPSEPWGCDISQGRS